MIVPKSEVLDKTIKTSVIEIIFETFLTNASTNFVIKQDKRKENRLRFLIAYSYFLAAKFGDVYLTDDKNGAALILYPEKKRTSLSTIFWDVKLIFKSIGLKKVFKVLDREAKLKKCFPKAPYVHLWYVGVKEKEQGKGIGTELIKNIITSAQDKTVYLETSNPLVWPLYKRLGFVHTNSLNYPNYLLKIYELKPPKNELGT